MVDNLTQFLADAKATQAAGFAFAQQLQLGDVIYLQGDLGAGKTTFTRGVLQGLGFLGKVKSPTYTLVEPYALASSDGAAFTLYHFDLYRFSDEEEWEAAGFREYFNKRSICLIEWPQKAENCLPQADFEIRMQVRETGRALELIRVSESAKSRINFASQIA